MTIKVGDNVVRKMGPGAPRSENDIIIEIINNLQSKEYRIRWASGVEETCLPGSFKTNGVRATPRQLATVAPAPQPTSVETVPDHQVEDQPPSYDESDVSSDSSEDLESSDNEVGINPPAPRR